MKQMKMTRANNNKQPKQVDRLAENTLSKPADQNLEPDKPAAQRREPDKPARARVEQQDMRHKKDES